MLILQQNDLFVEGGQRICYYHPNDENMIIKIDKSRHLSNLLEFEYYQYLQKKNVSFEFIAKCYGFVETNLGKGLVFEKIKDYDGNISLSFRKILQLQIITEEYENYLIENLKNYLFKNSILFSDCTSVNVLCKKINKNEFKLVIIDGLGPKKHDFKTILYYYFPLYKKYKIKKQWKTFCNNIRKVKKKIKSNEEF